MKHLLIIFSILLLSSPVNGDNHKGETLYKWFTSSGEVWKGFGDKGTHPKYTGEVENRVPNGLGFLIFPNGGKYVGEFKDGDFHGQGTYTSGDGSKYEGGYKDGQEHGQGIYIWSDGGKYIGEVKNEKFWNGTFYDIDGNIHNKFVNGKINP